MIMLRAKSHAITKLNMYNSLCSLDKDTHALPPRGGAESGSFAEQQGAVLSLRGVAMEDMSCTARWHTPSRMCIDVLLLFRKQRWQGTGGPDNVNQVEWVRDVDAGLLARGLLLMAEVDVASGCGRQREDKKPSCPLRTTQGLLGFQRPRSTPGTETSDMKINLATPES